MRPLQDVLRRALLLSFLGYASLATSGAAAPAQDSGSVPPCAMGLRCEYREAPLGIDSPRPRLSWRIEGPQRGLAQAAYQVLVASTAERLAHDEGDLWDSGRVISDKSLHVPYQGKPLTSLAKVHWKVRVWTVDAVTPPADRRNAASPWSEPSTWTMGLLAPKDWQARWIAPAKPGQGSKDLPLLRREFTVGKPVRRATLSICGLGFYEAFLNGREVGDAVLDPGWTNYRKSCLYSSYDVTGQIAAGANAIGVMLGNGMYNIPGGRYVKFTGSFGPPKLIAQLNLFFEDGTQQVVATDGAWKTTSGPIVFSCIFGGEDYDARSEQPGWDRASFDDHAWTPAAEVSGPGGKLVAQPQPPIRVMQSFDPVKVTELKSGALIYDLGQNFSGWPEIQLQGNAGVTVKLVPGELLDAAGGVSQRSSGGPAWFSYTLKGGGPETWHPQFSYYGFRYLQVEGASREADPARRGQRPQILGVRGLFLHHAAPTVGRFTCSNPTIEQVHRLITSAIRSNLQSVLTDCPHREKLGWLEVSHLLARGIMYNYEVPLLYTKISRDMSESQRPDGPVPSIAPEYTLFGGGFVDSPEWGSASVVNPWLVYCIYGDRQPLEDNYEVMKRYVAYLRSRARNGIVEYGLGDWCDVGPGSPGQSKLTSKGVTATAIYYYDLTILCQTATLLGKPDDADRFAREAEAVRIAFNKTFYRAADHCYDRNSQTANAMPLALGLAEDGHRDAVLDKLIQGIRAGGNRVTAGDVGFLFVVQALSAAGRGDVLYDMVCQSDGPGYVYQLRHGATSLAETWDTNPSCSQNHCMLGHAEEWFFRGLGGLSPTSPGFKQFEVRPQLVGDLREVNVGYDSLYGPITIQWSREGVGAPNTKLALRVFVPGNTQAMLYVPAATGAKITESGREPVRSPAVEFLRREPGTAVYRLGAGDYRFEVK